MSSSPLLHLIDFWPCALFSRSAFFLCLTLFLVAGLSSLVMRFSLLLFLRLLGLDLCATYVLFDSRTVFEQPLPFSLFCLSSLACALSLPRSLSLPFSHRFSRSLTASPMFSFSLSFSLFFSSSLSLFFLFSLFPLLQTLSLFFSPSFFRSPFRFLSLLFSLCALLFFLCGYFSVILSLFLCLICYPGVPFFSLRTLCTKNCLEESEYLFWRLLLPQFFLRSEWRKEAAYASHLGRVTFMVSTKGAVKASPSPRKAS